MTINVSEDFLKEITYAIETRRIEYFQGNTSEIENWRKNYQIVDVKITALEEIFAMGTYGDRNMAYDETDG